MSILLQKLICFVGWGFGLAVKGAPKVLKINEIGPHLSPEEVRQANCRYSCYKNHYQLHMIS